MKPEDKAVVQQALWVVRELMDDEHTHEALERADKAIFALRQLLEQTEPSVTVRYDLSAADTEAAIRDKLIELGWTPPAQPAVPTQCWKCGDMDAMGHAKCDVPACGMKEQPADHSEQHLDMVDHADELTIAYLDGVHTGKRLVKREWVDLTDEERRKLFDPLHDAPFEFAKRIEAKLKEKNT